MALYAPPPTALAQQEDIRPQGEEVELVLWVDGTLTVLGKENLELFANLIFNL